jgi:hypothetical protein
MSSDNNNNNNNDGGGKRSGGGGLDDFLDQPNESENLQRARAFLSEERLPISFGMESSEIDAAVEETNGKNQTTAVKEKGDILDASIVEPENKQNKEKDDNVVGEGKIKKSAIQQKMAEEISLAKAEEALQNNPYLNVVSRLSPSELISKFTTTAHPRVQDAVRATILGLIGNLPKMAFDTTTVTTGERLASLMFQLQMTGYMFKNAEYRLSLSASLGMDSVLAPQSSSYLLSGADDEDDGVEKDKKTDTLAGRVMGKIKVRYGAKNGSSSVADDDGSNKKEENEVTPEEEDGMAIEVDAAAYMSELRGQVSALRDELSEERAAKEEAIRKDLLLYIRTLPKQEMSQLTNTISPEVLVAMKGLVNVVMTGIGEGKISPDTVTEQSGEAMAQLCMWQLVVGYNLRELEVREQFRNRLDSLGVSTTNGKDDDSEFSSGFE